MLDPLTFLVLKEGSNPCLLLGVLAEVLHRRTAPEFVPEGCTLRTPEP